MEVGVGSFSDPEGLEGLAHFLGQSTVRFRSLPPFSSLVSAHFASIFSIRFVCAIRHRIRVVGNQSRQ